MMKTKSATGKNTFQTPADPQGNGSEKSQKQMKKAREVETSAPYSDHNGVDNSFNKGAMNQNQK